MLIYQMVQGRQAPALSGAVLVGVVAYKGMYTHTCIRQCNIYDIHNIQNVLHIWAYNGGAVLVGVVAYTGMQ